LTSTSAPRFDATHLTSIRQNANWRDLFAVLGIVQDSAKSKDWDWWGKSPFRSDERTASFHMNARGWYCHATGQGGGPIELVQRLHPGMTCYQAGRWLLEQGVSRIVTATREEVGVAGTEPDTGALPVNRPIRQDLRPLLDSQHPEFARRGIPPDVLQALGAGYLERTRQRKAPDPMNRRLVFQVRGLQDHGPAGTPESVVLGHIGRATTPEQEASDGKWWTYRGFSKSLELYNLDLLILEEAARQQMQETGIVLVVEGCFDVAKLRAVGVLNAVAVFGAQMSPAQGERLRQVVTLTEAKRVHLFLDRDDAGRKGTSAALELLRAADIPVSSFDWEHAWNSPRRTGIVIPPSITDPADFELEQLRWLRQHGFL